MNAVVIDQKPEQPERALPVVQEGSPAALMLSALGQGASLESIEKMMDLQDRWERGQAEKQYNAAFAAFKAEAVKIIKNKTVDGNSPLKGKTYAELHAVVNAITPALSKHGLSAAWKITKDEKDWIEVTCTLKHIAGHSESVTMGGPPDSGGAKNPIQSRASTISYLERYTLKAITGLSEQDDDKDGNAPAQVPEELLSRAETATEGGTKSYEAFFKGLSREERKALMPEYNRLKADAAKHGSE